MEYANHIHGRTASILASLTGSIAYADETHSRQNQLLKEGLDILGMHADLTPRNIRDPQDQCGYTTLGCPRGNKQVRSLDNLLCSMLPSSEPLLSKWHKWLRA